jgi:hypothetical protein
MLKLFNSVPKRTVFGRFAAAEKCSQQEKIFRKF